MNKLDRTKEPKPECLSDEERVAKWTANWEKKNQNGETFNWPTHQKQRINQPISAILSKLTQAHCSYCDKDNVVKGVEMPSIDHFKPKAEHPKEVYSWENLFLACNQCQNYKGERFPINPLKPDSTAYDFDYWFEIKWETHEIVPSMLRNAEDQARAQETIEWLGLNKDGRPSAREKVLKMYIACVESASEFSIDEFSYRFFLERGY